MTTPTTGSARSLERGFAIDAVAMASRVCRRIRAEFDPSEATAKADRSPVTVADLAGQALISMALAEALPADGLMGEEDSTQLAASPLLAQAVLAFDPQVELPRGIRVWLAHGLRDEVIDPEASRRLARTGTPELVRLIEVDDDHSLHGMVSSGELVALVRELCAAGPPAPHRP